MSIICLHSGNGVVFSERMVVGAKMSGGRILGSGHSAFFQGELVVSFIAERVLEHLGVVGGRGRGVLGHASHI